MRYYILTQKNFSKDEFIKIEDWAFEQSSNYGYALFKVYYSILMEQNIYLNLN
jgi:hypothetical protein